MQVRTRANDYSSPTEEKFHEQIGRIREETIRNTKYYHQMKSYMSDLEMIIHINKTMANTIKLVRQYVVFLNSPCVLSDALVRKERLFRTILSKKKDFANEKLTVCSESYEKQHQVLMDRCEKINRIIYNYFNRKYAVILFKTNRDIYRHILSYL